MTKMFKGNQGNHKFVGGNSSQYVSRYNDFMVMVDGLQASLQSGFASEKKNFEIISDSKEKYNEIMKSEGAEKSAIDDVVDRFRKTKSVQVALGLYDNQIELCSTVFNSLNSGVSLSAIIAHSQRGKTAIIILSKILLNVEEMKKSEDRIITTIIAPDSNSILEQTDQDYRRISAALSFLMVDGIRVDEAMEEVARCQKTVLASLKKQKSIFIARKGKRDENLKFYEAYAQCLKNNQLGKFTKVRFILDEGDEALKNESFLDLMLKKFGDKYCAVLCSATNYPYKDLSDINIIELPVDDNYCGLFDGKQIKLIGEFEILQIIDAVTGRTPPKSIKALRSRSIIGSLEPLYKNLRKGINPSISVKVVDVDLAVQTGCSIREASDSAPSSDILADVTAAELGFNGLPFNGTGGLTLRVHNTMGVVLNYATSLAQKVFSDTVVCRFDSKGAKYYIKGLGWHTADEAKTIPDAIEAAKKATGATYFVMFVVGKARRGDRVPPCIGFDVTDPSYMTALEQGMAGRNTGYGKENTITILSDYANHIVKMVRFYHAKTGKKPLFIKPDQFSNREYNMASLTNNIALNRGSYLWDKMPQSVKIAFSHMNDYVINNVLDHSKNHVSRIRGVKYLPVFEFFTPQVLADFEQAADLFYDQETPNVQILRVDAETFMKQRGEKVSTKRTYDRDGNSVSFGFRTVVSDPSKNREFADSPRYQHGKSKSQEEGDVSVRVIAHDTKFVEPMLKIDFDKRCLAGIVFPLSRLAVVDCTDIDSYETTLPNAGTLPYTCFANSDDQARSDYLRDRKKKVA